jgi:c-di-GMP-binding flagellar brake protein YcgR
MSAGKVDPKNVVSITDPLEIRRILARAAGEQIRAVVSAGSGQRRFESNVEDYDARLKALILRRPADFQEIERCLVLLFSKGQQALGFTGRLVPQADADSIAVTTPRKILKIQRRSEVRLEIPAGYNISVPIFQIRRRVLDLSAQGLAFLVGSADEVSRFIPGTLLRRVPLKVHGRTITFDAEVRNSIPYRSGTEQFKVGVRFLRLKPEDAEFITALGLASFAPFILKAPRG